MISYDPLWATLQKRGITIYKLINTYNISRGTIDNLKHNRSITMASLNQLMEKLEINDVTEVISYTPDDKQPVVTQKLFLTIVAYLQTLIFSDDKIILQRREGFTEAICFYVLLFFVLQEHTNLPKKNLKFFQKVVVKTTLTCVLIEYTINVYSTEKNFINVNYCIYGASLYFFITKNNLRRKILCTYY